MRIARTLIPLAVLMTLGIGVACQKPAPAPAPEAPKVDEDAAKRAAEEEAKRKAAEEEARRKAEEEARRKAEAEAARQAEAAKQAAYRQAADAALKDINFEFNQSAIREIDKSKLQAIADFMKAYPQAKVQVEGHCDERGTVEYNLALGERRAHAAKTYLVSLGTEDARLSSISYGKERPKVNGVNEETWLINRRCEFKLQ